MMPNTKHRFIIGFRWLGIILLFVPLFFRWYISDASRYITMIRGPYPWSAMGSIGYQIVGVFFLPIMLSIACFIMASSFTEAKLFAWTAAPFRPHALRLTSLSLVIIAVVITLLVFLPAAIWK